jgi:hypothetical protein
MANARTRLVRMRQVFAIFCQLAVMRMVARVIEMRNRVDSLV